MTALQYLRDTLKNLSSPEHYLFSLNDLSAVFPSHSRDALQLLLSRAVKSGVLQRVCRSVYLYPDADPRNGLLLYHIASKLRAADFNYLSLESALSDAGVISQIPLNWITLMSSGRNRIVNCGRFGHIEFIHTQRSAQKLARYLSWDRQIRLWRASVPLALKDLKHTCRSEELIDWELANEFV